MGRRNRRRATNAQTEDSIVMTVDEILKETEDDDTEDVGATSVEDDEEVDTVEVDDTEDEKKRIFFKKKKDKVTNDTNDMEEEDDDDDDDDDDELDLDDPVKMGEWVLSVFLAAVPIINIICLLVWAFGQNNKPSKKTWARAKLVWLLVEVVLLALVAAFFIGMLTGGAF